MSKGMDTMPRTLSGTSTVSSATSDGRSNKIETRSLNVSRVLEAKLDWAAAARLCSAVGTADNVCCTDATEFCTWPADVPVTWATAAACAADPPGVVFCRGCRRTRVSVHCRSVLCPHLGVPGLRGRDRGGVLPEQVGRDQPREPGAVGGGQRGRQRRRERLLVGRGRGFGLGRGFFGLCGRTLQPADKGGGRSRHRRRGGADPRPGGQSRYH